MDGMNRKVLARSNLMWPNGLTLDYPNKLVIDIFIKRELPRYLVLYDYFDLFLIYIFNDVLHYTAQAATSMADDVIIYCYF